MKELIRCPLNKKRVVIPESVQRIQSSAFEECNKLTKIIIPDSVVFICSKSFYNCSSLKSIIIGKNVSKIGENAFDLCLNLQYIQYNGNIKPKVDITAFSRIGTYEVFTSVDYESNKFGTLNVKKQEITNSSLFSTIILFFKNLFVKRYKVNEL